MKHKYDSRVQQESISRTFSHLKWPYGLIIIAYGLLVVVTPGLGAWDSNATKFLSLSLLNLAAFLFLITQKEIRKNPELKLSFFNTRLGFIYTLLLIVSLLSFAKSINILESLVAFSKFFTVFSAAYIISVILRTNKGYLNLLCTLMVFLLIMDCITVFYNVVDYIRGNLSTIVDIKSVYSNKNILTSAIFVKIPFAFWLISFRTGWMRITGVLAFFLAFVAILFLSTRAFYLGIVILTLTFIVFQFLQKRRENAGNRLRLLMTYLGIIVAAVIIFSVVQMFVFSRLRQEDWNKDVVTRLGTIKEELSGMRVNEWKMSGKLIREDPLLGVGVGNWKIRVLKYENPATEGFVFLHFNHNDFIQVTAETGIFGGLLFLSLFILIWLKFIFAFFRSGKENETYKYLFIPAFGMLAYSVDASFNFPCDRPEMVSLFALFLGIAIALSGSNLFFKATVPGHLQLNPARHAGLSNIPALIFIPLMLAVISVLYINFNSLKFQLLVVRDLITGQHQLTYDEVQRGFPPVPTINAVDEPIALIKARYLNFEGKYKEAIEILKNDHSSPYYANNEYFLGLSYERAGFPDSALVHYKNASGIKPGNFDFLYSIGNISMQKGDTTIVIQMVNKYLETTKTNPAAWGFAADLMTRSGDLVQATNLVDSGMKYRPDDGNLLKQKEALVRLRKIKPFESIFNTAVAAFQKNDFPAAASSFSDFIGREPGLPEAYEYRSTCYYMTRQYQKCVSDIDIVLESGVQKGNLYNMRGAAYHELGNDMKACEDFQQAIKLGDPNAADNFQKYCGSGK